MAILKSAKKVIRSSAKKRVFNVRRKAGTDSAKKEVVRLVKVGKIEDARKALDALYKALDKTAKTKFIKKNKASRLKSRMAKFVNKVAASKK